MRKKSKYIVCTHRDRILGNNGKMLGELSAHIRIITGMPQQFSMSWLDENPRQAAVRKSWHYIVPCLHMDKLQRENLKQSWHSRLFLGRCCTRTTTTALGESRINDEVYEKFSRTFLSSLCFLKLQERPAYALFSATFQTQIVPRRLHKLALIRRNANSNKRQINEEKWMCDHGEKLKMIFWFESRLEY